MQVRSREDFVQALVSRIRDRMVRQPTRSRRSADELREIQVLYSQRLLQRWVVHGGTRLCGGALVVMNVSVRVHAFVLTAQPHAL